MDAPMIFIPIETSYTVYDFLSVINTNLPPYLALFPRYSRRHRSRIRILRIFFTFKI